jgi:PAB-dependent poly(A)-specific ribonuclease subunit 3
VQIASAIKTIHAANLAVRCLNPSKVIVTEKSRIRLNACAIMDVVQFDTERRPVSELQQEDFVLFGRLILAIATNNIAPSMVTKNALEQLSRTFGSELTQAVEWLVTPKPSGENKSITEFLSGIAGQVASSLDRSLHSMDSRTSELSRELENGRLFRLAAKLGTINERPEFDGDKTWSETGERYMIKLFRDYTFHQVDEHGRPVLDLGHVIRCLNNLDVGTEEKVRLMSRDEETVFVVTYKELKKQVNAAWSDLQKWSKGRY